MYLFIQPGSNKLVDVYWIFLCLKNFHLNKLDFFKSCFRNSTGFFQNISYVTPDNFNSFTDLIGQRITNAPFLSIYIKTDKVFFSPVNFVQLKDKIPRYGG